MTRHSIRQRLIFLLAMPIAALLYFGSSMVSERHQEAREMDHVRRLAEIAVRAGDLLHHTQRERGLSAGFLGSQGDSTFKAQLLAERRETDGAITAFRSAVEALDKAEIGDDLARGYAEVGRSLQELAFRRSGVDGMTVSAAEAVAFYSGMNGRILAMVTDMSRTSTVVAMANRGIAYVSLMRAKEAAGIERAVLSNAYGAGKFAPGMYARLLTLIALQDDYLSTFRTYTGEAGWQKYGEAVKGDFVEATRAMRETAVGSGGGAVSGVDPKAWFARQTEKIDAMRKVEAWLAEEILSASARLSATASRTFVAALLAMGVVVLLTLLLAAYVLRSIVRPLGRAVEVLGAVASGDFTRRLDVDGKDEVGQMAASLNQAVEAIRTALGEVRAVSTTVATAAQQISAAAGEMAGGAQRQASSLEETAASLEEITATVRQNAQNAHEANQIAVSSREVAERGGKVVGEAVQAMTEISRSSARIADITTAIDEIAFQTNLLALNAAVEAARAGQQGRGFAVVATEVRNLAQRSAGAAREIKALIEDSTRKVDVGTQLVNRSGQMLEEIVASVKRVTHIVAEIATASKEQTTGIEQVNQAVAQMDQVTQGSAARTEEMSGTAVAMAAQAEQLRLTVAQFRVGADDEGEDAPSAEEPAPTPELSPPSPAVRSKPARRSGADKDGDDTSRAL